MWNIQSFYTLKFLQCPKLKIQRFVEEVTMQAASWPSFDFHLVGVIMIGLPLPLKKVRISPVTLYPPFHTMSASLLMA